MDGNLDTNAPRQAEALRKAHDNPWAVLAMLFLVTAVCGLPVLWTSRGFSGPAKAVWTLVVLAYTALIFWLFWLVMAWSWSRIAPLFG